MKSDLRPDSVPERLREFVVAASSISVMVVEDFQPFRRFVSSKLEQRSELRVVCEVSDGLEAVQKAEELKPDLILLDIHLPRLNGIEAARRILGLAPESRIIFWSQYASPYVVQEAMKLGACGYVFRAHAGNDLLLAIDAVLTGNRFVSRTPPPSERGIRQWGAHRQSFGRGVILLAGATPARARQLGSRRHERRRAATKADLKQTAFTRLNRPRRELMEVQPDHRDQ